MSTTQNTPTHVRYLCGYAEIREHNLQSSWRIEQADRAPGDTDQSIMNALQRHHDELGQKVRESIACMELLQRATETIEERIAARAD